MKEALSSLLDQVRACRICADRLPMGPRPVLQIGANARLLIAGQAPGRKVHQTGVPFDDPSGENLRAWLGIDRAVFYDPEKTAILPMAFCYPGRGQSGDLPPSDECAPLWRERILSQLPNVKLTVIIGRYAQFYHLGIRGKATLTETVRSFHEYLPDVFPLPHPSPRNGPWLKRHPWFERDVIPALKESVSKAV
ncbi:MAG: uracil-DNA glycosylase family protein [Pseudomonadota bacterium]